jgi:hypothetical protein
MRLAGNGRGVPEQLKSGKVSKNLAAKYFNGSGWLFIELTGCSHRGAC